jgi:hypothetical protein
MSNQKYLMGKLFFTKKYKLQIFLFVLFSVYSLFLSQTALGATLNLTATWTLNTEPDIKEYRLYRTDTTRTLLGTITHPNHSYPFTVTVPDGSSGTLLFVVTAIDTSNYESADSNQASYPYNLSTTTVTINATDNTATEAGTTTGTFTVSRTGSTSGALTVYYSVSGTATSGSDYNSLSGSVTIASGSSTGTITVTPINDTVVESDETVIVTLSSNAAYTVGSPGSATVTIISDDVGETITPPTTPSLGSSRLTGTLTKYSASDSNMYTGTSYQFTTSGSSSSAGSPVEYQFSWGDGTYSSWSSPSRSSCSQSDVWTTAGTYQVRARARSKSNTACVSDWSNALSISVLGKAFIHITSPNGGENLAVGTTHTITWDSTYLNPSGTIYLFYQFDGAWHPITTLSPSNTSFGWTIPRIPAGVTSPAPSGSRRSRQPIAIWIGNWANGGWECFDTSDQTFRILYDAWVCKISGADQGGTTLLFDQDSFEGYGISLKWGMFDIDGNYNVDAQGAMSGAYTIRDFTSGTVLGSGSFTGSVDSSSKKLTLNLTASGGTISISGVRFVSDPAIPGDWTGTLSGSVSASLTSLMIDPYELGDDLYSNVFGFLGSGSIIEGSYINIEGYFYLTSTTTSRSNSTNVYGIYKLTGAIDEIGVLTGALNPTKGTISFTMTSQNGNKYTLSGNAVSQVTERPRFFRRFSRK